MASTKPGDPVCANLLISIDLLRYFCSLNANLFHPILTVFKLPDELIRSVLSHISPLPQLTGHRVRFCTQGIHGIRDSHQQRMDFLRPLSMTCRTMRLRLTPWVWERLGTTYSRSSWDPKFLVRKLNTLVNVLRADIFLATSVKYHHTFFVHGPVPIHIL